MQWVLLLRRHRYDERTTLGTRIGQLSPSLRSRSLILVLSDLHDPTAVESLRRLSQLHDCIVLELEDPAETGLRGAGFLRAGEAETGREFTTHGRRRWTEGDDAAPALRRAGIDHLRIRTDRPFEHALRQLFRARGWAGRGTR
jgi:hypothetical protein